MPEKKPIPTERQIEVDEHGRLKVVIEDNGGGFGDIPDNPDRELGKVTAQLTGSTVAESKTQANAVNNVLTFGEPIRSIEIWHDEDDPKEFIVNGITLHIGPGGWRSPVGGTPSADVTVPADVDCVVTRLV